MTHAFAGQNLPRLACTLNTTNITLEINNRCLSFTGHDLTCSSTIGRTSPNDLWSNYRLSKLIVLNVAAQCLWSSSANYMIYRGTLRRKSKAFLQSQTGGKMTNMHLFLQTVGCKNRLQPSLVKCQLWEVGLRSLVRRNFYRHITYRISLLCEEQLVSLLDCTCAI